VATPIFSVAPGTYASAQTVQIVCPTAGATIYYTLNNTEPNENKTKYTVPLVLSSNTTLKAKAFKDGMDASFIRSGKYYIGSWNAFTNNTFWTPKTERGTGFPYGIWTGTVWTRNEDTAEKDIWITPIDVWSIGYRPKKFRMTYTGTKPGSVQIYWFGGTVSIGITYGDYDSLEEENLVIGGIPIDADIDEILIPAVAADFEISKIEFFL